MSNSIGNLFVVTSFGESHGKCVGVVIDGCPAGLAVTQEEIQKEIDKRRPTISSGGTPRVEEDKVEIISGIYNGFSTGAPICLMIANKIANSNDYDKTRYTPRPGHADFTAFVKYGGFNDFRGGGRFSGRITASFVMAGAIARKLLEIQGIKIVAHTVEIAGIKARQLKVDEIVQNVEQNSLRCADSQAADEMLKKIAEAGKEGDTLGGIVEGIAMNVPVGIGEPIFGSLDSELAKAMLSIPAVKGVEFGAGFLASKMKGSENNDPFAIRNKQIETITNNAGGLLGGISTGSPIVLKVAIKPPPSIHQTQNTVNMKEMKPEQLLIGGRHDVCVVPRAVVVVEAMMSIVLCDLAMLNGSIPRIIK